MARVGSKLGFRRLGVDSRVGTRVDRRISGLGSKGATQIINEDALTWDSTPISWNGIELKWSSS